MQEEDLVSQEQKVQEASADDGVVKVDLRDFNEQKEDTDVQEQPGEEVQQPDEVQSESSEDEGQQDEQVHTDNAESEEQVEDEDPVLEVVEDEEDQEERKEDPVVESDTKTEAEAEEKGIELPENIEKLVQFMNETGGTLEDYVELNKDIDSLDEKQLVVDYYKRTKPHLNDEEIDFLIEDSFSYDEDIDDDREARRKSLLYKEEVQKAKEYLNNMKSKYYDEIKAGSRLTPEQQKAVEFFNRYQKENEESAKLTQRQAEVFSKKTSELFNENFKGFEYSVGDKKYRFNVKDAGKVKETQGDISNMLKKFLGEDNTLSDAKGYHKAMFTAMNADAVAEHFYQQGRADQAKETNKRSKNIDMNPRGSHNGVVESNGIKVRAISGDDSGKLRVKINK